MQILCEPPPKPLRGRPCNGCGLCCRMERCGLSVEIIGAGPGPCPALEYEDGRAWCGILRNPLKWIDDPLHKTFPAWMLPAVIGEIQRTVAYMLAIGAGCDSDDPVLTGIKPG